MTILTAWTSYASDSEIRVGVMLDGDSTVSGIFHAGTHGDITAVSSVAASGWGLLTFTGLAAGWSGTIDVTTPTDSTTLTAHTLDPTPGPSKIISGSCQRTGSNHPVFTAVGNEAADLIIHQGDLHYADATDEATYRSAMQTDFSASNFRFMLQSAPMTYRYDNHDWGGNDSYKDSPCAAFVPGAYRELAGPQVNDREIYRTYVHKGVRYVELDCWSARDDHFATDSATKYMLSPAQEQWFYDTMTAAQEPLIILATHFPLYGNWLPNARWGDYQYQGKRIWNFFRSHLDIAARTVAIGGDSHNVCADDGVNTMWGIPSLNASPFDRTGDPVGSASGTWDIVNNVRTDDSGYYSRLSINWTTYTVDLTWEAVEVTGASQQSTVATYTKSLPRTVTPPSFRVMVNGELRPVSSVALGNTGKWRPVPTMRYNGAEIDVPPYGDITGPSVPTGVVFSAITTTSATVTWNASSRGTYAVTGYQVELNGNTLPVISGTSQNLTGLTPGTQQSVRVRAQDAAGAYSAWTAASTFSTASAAVPPSVPTGLNASTVAPTYVTLKWTASTPGDTAINGYEVRLNGVSQGFVTTNLTSPSMTIYSLTPEVSYTAAVRARDADGDLSAWTADITFTTPASIPAAPTNVRATVTSATTATISWGVVNATDTAILGYEVELNGTSLGFVASTATNRALTGLTANASQSVRVRAQDSDNDYGPWSTALSFLTVATTTPANSLISAYNFDDPSAGTTWLDRSPNHRDVLRRGYQVTPGHGGTGGAAKTSSVNSPFFAGADNNNNSGIDPATYETPARSWSAWINTVAAVSTTTPQQAMCYRYDGSTMCFGIFIAWGNSNGTARWRKGTTNSDFAFTVPGTPGWHHFAQTYDSATGACALFIDGTQVVTQNIGAGSLTAMPAGVMASGGANIVWEPSSYQALIDDLRFYNYAIAASQVTSDMNNAVVPISQATMPFTLPTQLG